jgi:hypothetical protein
MENPAGFERETRVFLFVVLRRDDIPDSKLDRVWRKHRKKCILGKLKERLEKVQ